MGFDFYKGKTILVTGHTGFKGSWLCLWLNKLGANVIGYALDPLYDKGVFTRCNLSDNITDIRADIRDLEKLRQVFKEHKPEIVFHLAAQPIVRQSFDEPHYTIETNIMGTLNILECIKNSDSVKSCVIITSDKCYKNKEWVFGYRENDELGGSDPYSASKSCAEIISDSYIKSFFTHSQKNIATARAGNVIGGGDWSKDRIVPDSIKALETDSPIPVRNPLAVRPWQHVLEPLGGYLLLAQKLFSDRSFVGAWNFGPSYDSIKTVDYVAKTLVKHWGKGTIERAKVDDNKHETKLLSLDSSKAQLLLNWKPVFSLDKAIQLIAEWHKSEDALAACNKQIDLYTDLFAKVDKNE